MVPEGIIDHLLRLLRRASIAHTRFELGWNLQRSPKYTVQVWILTEELVQDGIFRGAQSTYRYGTLQQELVQEVRCSNTIVTRQQQAARVRSS